MEDYILHNAESVEERNIFLLYHTNLDLKSEHK